MRKRFNFRVDFLSLPKASWGTSCTQHGPVRRRKSDPGGAPGPSRSVPGATPEAVWSQKAARNHPDPLETPILEHFGDDFVSFLLIFVTQKWSLEPFKWPSENYSRMQIIGNMWPHASCHLRKFMSIYDDQKSDRRRAKGAASSPHNPEIISFVIKFWTHSQQFLHVNLPTAKRLNST